MPYDDVIQSVKNEITSLIEEGNGTEYGIYKTSPRSGRSRFCDADAGWFLDHLPQSKEYMNNYIGLIAGCYELAKRQMNRNNIPPEQAQAIQNSLDLTEKIIGILDNYNMIQNQNI
jgi:hypothetical protein